MLVAAAVAALALLLRAAADLDAAALRAADAAVAVGTAAREVSTVPVPVALGLLGAAVTLAGAVLVALLGPRWPVMGRAPRRGAGARPGRPRSAWQALDAGEDPTEEPGGSLRSSA